MTAAPATSPWGADFAVWFDNLPEDLGGSGSVGWTSVADRDAWFGDLHDSLASMHMMAYERSTEAQITDSVATEAALFPGELRVGLNEEVGSTWADIDSLFAMAEAVEATGHRVDLHSFSAIRGQLPP